MQVCNTICSLFLQRWRGLPCIFSRRRSCSAAALPVVSLHMQHMSGLPYVNAALAEKGVAFQAPAQLQRGGLLLLDGVVYAGYGGNSGDCQECEDFLIHAC